MSRLARLLFFAVILVVAAEASARIFWRVSYGVSLRDARHVLLAFYPELRRVEGIRPSRHDDFYDILILGGSVLHRDWGAVEQAIVEQLARGGHFNLRVSNLAMPGHTSRDSLLKYAAVEDARFDIVILYEGINDARALNAPPDVFREDYSHYAWYEIVNAMAPYHGTARFALPHTVRYLSIQIHQMLMSRRYVPQGPPPADFGNETRGIASFTHNLTSLLEIASRRRDPVTLMTFATYVPADYSLDAFRRHALDYDLHLSPIDLWGPPQGVIAMIARQNEVIRSLAAGNPHVLFVDQATLMPTGAKYFNDVCHLTMPGALAFVAPLVEALKPTFQTR